MNALQAPSTADGQSEGACAAHRFNQEIIQGAAEGIIVYDTELRYVVWNRFMAELTGMPAEEVLGKHAPTLFPFLATSGIEKLLRRALAGDTVTLTDTLVQMPRTGREVWESNRYAPCRDARGEIVGVIALVSDITERKNAEIALRQALRDLDRLKNQLQSENAFLQEKLRADHPPEEIIVGDSRELRLALSAAERVAPTDSTVLLWGETGTGKELFARAIHARSTRAARPFVKVNCGAIPVGLAGSELFGHVRGAFTGALHARTGRFELAHRGTIFLDEVGELSPDLQVTLLRVLQEHEFEPIGSDRTQHVDVRVVAATNRDLEAEVAAGRFRRDLFYRLNVFPIEIPPLRERTGDIPRLAASFLERFGNKLRRPDLTFSSGAMAWMSNYPWPGNVRELENVVERAAILARGAVIDRDEVLVGSTSVPAPQATGRKLADVERAHIVDVLRGTGGVIEGERGAATVLGLHPNTLRSRMSKLGIRRGHHGIS